MPAKKFRFVSPGVQVKEIDRSQLPALPDAIGPVLIGRTLRGPGMVPVTVRSYEEFVEKFGAPDRGAGSTDVWRKGNTTAPTYASYAAEAYLRNSTPLTMVRLMGTQNSNAADGTDAEAGWKTDKAYGLFVMESSASAGSVSGSDGQGLKAALAAVFYGNANAIKLVGKDLSDSDGIHESGTLVKNTKSYEFKAIIESGSAAAKTVSFNLNKSSSKYIRKVFNTNPTLANSDITTNTSSYWLGESFETFAKERVAGNSAGASEGSCLAFIAEIGNNDFAGSDFKGVEAQPGKSGWVIGQDLNPLSSSFSSSNMPKLFRFAASEGLGGDWEQGNIKISIFDIKAPVNEYQKYGTFSVGIRKIDDTDASPEFVEVFSGCSLDPKSPNYLAAKIGDRHLEWDETEKYHKELGEYPNVSRYVRVEMNSTIEQGGLDPELLPFGFFGHPRLKTISAVSASVTSSIGGALTNTGMDFAGQADYNDFTASIAFPSMRTRVSASDAGTLDDTQVFFGVVPNDGASGSLPRLNEDHIDLARAKPAEINYYEASEDTTNLENAFIFTLDELVVTGSATEGRKVYWEAGSRLGGSSLTSLESGSHLLGKWDWSTGVSASVAADKSYKDVLNAGFDKFTLPLFGGADGLDITEREPFRNEFTDNGTANNNYAVNSLERALDTIRQPEVLNMNLLVLPGITNKAVTKKAIDVCENRGDALAIIDIAGGYKPSSENADAENLRLGSVSETITAIESRNLNTSYGCTYYPWVKVLDTESGQPLWMPPSVVALGTMASSQESSEVWFAPAGFNRGGLSLGSSGLSVVGVREKLTAKQRDKLYERNINPIASFPSEGIVIFGQKTLQAIPSALDRINVRRLVIFLKKQISIIASGLLFEPNVEDTWNKFKRPASALLESVKTGNGISDFKLVLDSTTTTAEEIDRNMMYAKLFIKPVYAIEFIGIDFVITNTGASFEDL